MCFTLMFAYAVTLIIACFVAQTPLLVAAVPVLAAVGVVFGTAWLGWLAAFSMRGTIEWALETNHKSERRENLLRTTQVELEHALLDRDRLNYQLKGLNVDLEAARAAAEAAYRSKASFMATMSHELRTPLNLVIGFSTAMVEHPEMYGDETLPPMYHDDLLEIQQSGKHLLSLINDILDLGEGGGGALGAEPRLARPRAAAERNAQVVAGTGARPPTDAARRLPARATARVGRRSARAPGAAEPVVERLQVLQARFGNARRARGGRPGGSVGARHGHRHRPR